MVIQEKLSFSDLVALKSSPDSIRKRFKEIYEKNPDGISVNSETYFSAVKPAITEQYGQACYKTLGEFLYKKGNGKAPSSAVVGSNYAVNHGDEEAEISLTVQGSWTDEQSWLSSSTTGLSISSKFTIAGVFETGMEFSVSTTVGESSSKSTSRSTSATVTVKVPPRSKKKLELVGTMKQESMDFEVPITVRGMFGANFPNRVKDHYFWFESAESVLTQTSGTIKGTIKNTAVFNVQTEIGKTEPLKVTDSSFAH